MSKKIDNSGSVLLWLITIALMGFTAFRSVDLIQSTLPADAQMLAYAALAGLDGGVLAWLFWTTRSAHGGTQRTIGSLMIIVDLAGISAAVLGDTMRIADVGSKEIVGMIAVYVVPVIIVSNVIACVVAHLVDPAQELRDANRTLQDEMERQKAEWVRSNAPKLAAEVAAEQARHHADQEIAKFRGAGGNPVMEFSKDGDDELSVIESRSGAAKMFGVTESELVEVPYTRQSDSNSKMEHGVAYVPKAKPRR